MKTLSLLTAAAALSFSTVAFAGGHANWSSVADDSSVAFGSVKKSVAGEVHHFTNVSGSVSEAGKLMVEIDLSSVETNIEIRNERFNKHVFTNGNTATITADIDMSEFEGLKAGEITYVDVEAALNFMGKSNDVEAELLVARLSEDRVLVTTTDFIMLSTANLGIDAGVDMLQKLAKLSDITRVTPVSVRMVFEK